ncbi:SPFH domain-Band 7 family protein [Salinihabitans flavidus]|uniref:SPFH domain-Band 7 family protein n=1 Tax=Salinihabitans flavidus TaxID=569882 RepID=A0A1H8QLJ9_9RHOB|nr:SPFH domain-Band 7 family protein [Salinihabitans flavidus]
MISVQLCNRTEAQPAELTQLVSNRALSKLVATEIAGTLADYGLEMPELYIENISLPPAVEAALDKRTSMGLAGDLGRYTQYSAAEAMTNAAQTPGSGMGAAIGAGMGIGMAQQMMGQQAGAASPGPWGPRPERAAAAPPPPPVEHVWHIAEHGETKGPFSRADLGRMAGTGDLRRDTHVWTAGQDGWKRAGEVTELAQLFTILPPPPPPGA